MPHDLTTELTIALIDLLMFVDGPTEKCHKPKPCTLCDAIRAARHAIERAHLEAHLDLRRKHIDFSLELGDKDAS